MSCTPTDGRFTSRTTVMKECVCCRGVVAGVYAVAGPSRDIVDWRI